jgi:hypothetical protein
VEITLALVVSLRKPPVETDFYWRFSLAPASENNISPGGLHKKTACGNMIFTSDFL